MGRRLEGHYMLAVVTNIRSYMGGLAQISPGARLRMTVRWTCGYFRAAIWSTLRAMPSRYFPGQHLAAPGAVCVPFRTLRLESATPVSLQMDGEPQGLRQNLEFSILPRALKLLVPSRSLPLLAHKAMLQLYAGI